MKRLIFITALLISASAHAATVTAFFQSQQLTGSSNKNCTYAWGGNEYVITIKSYKVCPTSIEVEI
jgi:hypothetical protein